jgi:serine/threonine protein kinase/tetratricopeptide (TPR) repeat protein
MSRPPDSHRSASPAGPTLDPPEPDGPESGEAAGTVDQSPSQIAAVVARSDREANGNADPTLSRATKSLHAGTPPPSEADPTDSQEAESPTQPAADRPAPVFATQVQAAAEVAAAAVASRSGITVAIPGYEILGELGRGGMGVVYKARQQGLDRIVALKTILAGGHAGPTGLARFRAEAEAVARLQHANVVQIYEVGAHNGLPYFSLEYCAGGSLLTRLDGTPWAPEAAARLVEDLARAVEAAHRAGIVHRDLKPANVLLTADGTAKITDFGLAKRIGEAGQTASGAILGTPSYMAPEQASGKGKEVGPAADVYALGAILYELLTGRPPFRAATALDTVMQVVHEEPVPPVRLQPRLPRDLDTICLKCLEKLPGRRYASALEVADDLQRFLTHEPIRSRPVGVVERVLKWARRRPAAAALVGVSGVALLSLLLGGVLYAESLRDRTQLAERELNDRRRLDDTQQKTRSLLDQGRAAMAAKHWEQARLDLSNALAQIGPEPELDEQRAEVSRLLEQVQVQLDQQEAERRARERHQHFKGIRDQALLHATLSVGEDLAANLQKTEEDARNALALFGISPEGDTPPVLGEGFTAKQRQEIGEDCYLLLLVWAEAASQRRPAEKPEASRDRTEQALRLLRRTEALGIATRSYHLRRARYLQRLGRQAEADDENRRAQQLPLSRALDYYLSGDDHYQQDDLAAAVRDFENVRRLKPGDFWARYFLSACYLRLDRFAEATNSLTDCIQEQPGFVWPYLMRAFANGQLGQLGDAEEDFKKAEEVLKASPDAEARYALYANRGVLRARQPGRAADAIADLKQAVRCQPEHYQAYLTLAMIYKHRQEWQTAREYFDQAIARHPESAFLYRNRAQFFVARRELDQALRDYDRAIELGAKARGDGHDLARDYFQRGWILHQQARYAEAVPAFDEAVKTWPALTKAYLNRAEAELRLKQYAEAVRSLEEYQRNGGKPKPQVYQARAQALARLGKYPQAIEAYTLAIEMEPKSSLPRAERGRLHLTMHAADLARRDFEDAIARDQANADAYNGLAQALLSQGDYDRAIANAETALHKAPDNPQVLFDAARTLGLGMSQLDADVAKFPPLTKRTVYEEAHERRTQCRDRALRLLREALAGLPAAERGEFWREHVLRDEALEPIRRSPEFDRLRKEYANLATPRGAPRN